jgi:hypothetical protein
LSSVHGALAMPRRMLTRRNMLNTM